jgi:hypothetical protein
MEDQTAHPTKKKRDRLLFMFMAARLHRFAAKAELAELFALEQPLH